MKITRSHLIRLNPTPEQEVYFRKACGVARHAYNWALARWKDYRSQGKRVSMKDLKAEYNQIKGEQFPLISDVPVVASSERKFACGAESSGSLCGESETFCAEAGTKVL